MATETVVAVRAEYSELEAAISATNALLAAVGGQLLENEVPEIHDILQDLERCAEHPSIEEYGIAHGGLNSIIYRLCDVMKKVAAAGHSASVAAGNDAQAYPAHSHGPN